MKKKSGFTLLELLVMLAVVGVLVAVGAPTMSQFIKNNRLTTQINILVGDLAYARSEAVTRNLPVVVCASSNQTSCSSANWADGWIVFSDIDNNGDVTFFDIALVVDAWKGKYTIASFEIVNLAGCPPNDQIDFFDIAADIDAWRWRPYPCTLPCP